MRYTNKYTFKNSEAPQWRMTDDGFLRCTARVLKETTLVYSKEELDNYPDDFDKEEANILVSGEALSDVESLKSLEGVPVVSWDHVWTDPSVVKQVSIGSVSGTPKVEEGFLICDLFITDKKAIEQIKNGTIGEISAAYYADLLYEPGIFNGNPYDAKKGMLRYNHIAIIPVGEGRAGPEVKIINKLKESPKMPDEQKLIRVQARKSKKYLNMDEGSAEIYEEESGQYAEDEKKYNKDAEDWGVEKTTNAEVEQKLQARIKELEGEVAAYKQHMEAMGDQNAIEQAARDMVMEQDDAGQILENSEVMNADGSKMDEEKTKEYKNTLKNLHGEKLQNSVLSAVGIDTTGMNKDALKGAWSVRKQIANKPKKKVAGTEMLNKSFKECSVPKVRTPRERLGIK